MAGRRWGSGSLIVSQTSHQRSSTDRDSSRADEFPAETCEDSFDWNCHRIDASDDRDHSTRPTAEEATASGHVRLSRSPRPTNLLAEREVVCDISMDEEGARPVAVKVSSDTLGATTPSQEQAVDVLARLRQESEDLQKQREALERQREALERERQQLYEQYNQARKQLAELEAETRERLYFDFPRRTWHLVDHVPQAKRRTNMPTHPTFHVQRPEKGALLPTSEKIWLPCCWDEKGELRACHQRGLHRHQQTARLFLRRAATQTADCVTFLAGGVAVVIILNFHGSIGHSPNPETNQPWLILLPLIDRLPLGSTFISPTLPVYLIAIATYSAAGIYHLARPPRYWANFGLLAAIISVLTGAVLGPRAMLHGFILGGFLSLVCSKVLALLASG